MAESEKRGRRVMIAVDESDHSQCAFEFYMEKVARDDDEVFIAHSPEVNINISVGFQMDENEIKKLTDKMQAAQLKAEQLTTGYISCLRGKDPGKRQIKGQVVELERGKIKDIGAQICKAAADNYIDIIIVGTRGLGMIRRTILGSVSEYVVKHAPCNVMIAKSNKSTADLKKLATGK